MKKYVVKIDDISEEFKKVCNLAIKANGFNYNKKANYFSLVGSGKRWNIDSHYISEVRNFYPDVEILSEEEFKKKYLISKLQGG